LAEARRGPLAIAFLSMILMGAIFSMTGALLPVIVRDLQISDAQAGLLVSSPAVGYVITAAFSGALGDRLGFRRIWLVGIALGVLALVGVSQAPSFLWLLPAMAAVGLVGGALDGAINPLIVTLYGERSGGILNWVHLFFGLGATFTPLLVGLGLRAGLAWRAHFAALSGYVLLVGVVIVLTRFPPARRRADDGREIAPLRAMLTSRLVVLGVIAMFLYVGSEASMFSWIALYLERLHAVTASTASLGVSVFGAAMMVGRLICGRIADGVGYKRLVVGGSWLGALGVAAMLFLPGTAWPWVGAALTGLSFAGIFATLMADITRRTPAHTGAVAGFICSAGGLGSIVVPWLVGQVADVSSLSLGMTLVILSSVAMGAVYART
jgi:fucose permease